MNIEMIKSWKIFGKEKVCMRVGVNQLDSKIGPIIALKTLETHRVRKF